MNKDSLSNFLESKGYKEVRSEKTASFGDYVKQFSSSLIEVRLSSSRSIVTLDIGSHADPNNWYDVALVKALVNKEDELIKASSFESLADFFATEHDQIEALFSPDQLPNTKKRLEKLEKKRVSQMFPNL